MMLATTPVLLDVESRSRADLKAIGGRRYWEHPSSEILCVAWHDTADGSEGVWLPGDTWQHLGRVLAAHNAHGFDRFALEAYGIAASGWIDTSQLARKAGLPGALDALGVRWCGMPKDTQASRFTRALSSVRRPTKRTATAEHPAIDAADWATMGDDERRARGVLPVITPEVLERVVAYCRSDVAIMVAAWPRLREWLAVDGEIEALDAALNDRGVCFDVALARRLLHEDARCAAAELARASAELGIDAATIAAAARSPERFCAIAGTPDAQAETVDMLLDGSDDAAQHARVYPAAVALARVRRALASIARGKLLAGLARVSDDGRMRDALRYYGAHTGRWSGKGMQLHNLPRPAPRFDGVNVDALAAEVLAGRACDADEIALLVRATLYAPDGYVLIVRDFSSIEARATAWAAGDSAAVDVFRSGRDPYKVAANAIFGVPYDDVAKSQRQIGKVAELACGYGGGPNAFEKMAYTYKLGHALDGLDTRAIVTAWRELHRPIVSLWYACERAFRAACEGRAKYAGPFEFVPDAGRVACFLPSGRPIVYNGAYATEDGIAYTGSRGREHVYGGKLVENAIQALCRDLMCHALLAAERAGLRPVLHVHDEIVCEVDASRADAAGALLQAVMLDLPPWAAGFPIGADGWTGRRYRK